MDKFKPAHFVAAIGWTFIAWESGMLLTRQIPADFMAWAFWVFFFLVAVMGSAVASARTK